MKGNHDRCDLFLSTEESSNIQIENFTIKSSNVFPSLIFMLRVFARKQIENSMLSQEWTA